MRIDLGLDLLGPVHGLGPIDRAQSAKLGMKPRSADMLLADPAGGMTRPDDRVSVFPWTCPGGKFPPHGGGGRDAGSLPG